MSCLHIWLQVYKVDFKNFFFRGATGPRRRRTVDPRRDRVQRSEHLRPPAGRLSQGGELYRLDRQINPISAYDSLNKGLS